MTLGLTVGKRLAHSAELKALAEGVKVLIVHDVGISWKAGQHVLLWCPTLGPLESHPFTIANVPKESRENSLNTVRLIIRAHSGFTRKLFRQITSSATVTAFLRGPFGKLRTWNTYETLVLISASTSPSFTLPTLETVLNDPSCIKRINCLFLVRHKSHLVGCLSRLRGVASHPRSSEVSLHIVIGLTGKQADSICEDDAASKLGSLSTSISFSTPAKTLVQSHATTTERFSSSRDRVVADSVLTLYRRMGAQRGYRSQWRTTQSWH